MKWLHWTERGPAPEQGSVLLEGLPGIGHVGQLAAQHAVESLGGSLWMDLHGPDFPPQAIVEPDGVARLAGLRLWSVPAADGNAPLVVLTGDSQPLSPHGQFMVTLEALDGLAPYGVTRMYTLGGITARGRERRVLGAATDAAMVDRLRGHGAVFDDMGPEGGIIGASGVFLGLGALRGIQGGCLMGESDGHVVDRQAAQNVLRILGALVGRDFPAEGLEATAGRIEEQLQFLDEVRYFANPSDAPEQHYIG